MILEELFQPTNPDLLYENIIFFFIQYENIKDLPFKNVTYRVNYVY